MNKFRKVGLIGYNGKIKVNNSLLSAVLNEKRGQRRINRSRLPACSIAANEAERCMATTLKSWLPNLATKKRRVLQTNSLHRR
jgi:hypothetical protein